MKFVVVKKTYADAVDRSHFLSHYPDTYPLESTEVEAESIEAVQAAYPGNLVLDVPSFNTYMQVLRQEYPIDKNKEEPGFWAWFFGS